MTSIYALCHPETHEIRYVGKTLRTLDYRLATHCSDKRNTHRANWVRSLKPLKPIIIELEAVGDSWVDAEQFWISYFKSLGARLTNLTAGGEGTIGYKPTTETLVKMSEVQKGNKHGEKYNQEVVAEIFELRRNDLSYQKISTMTGVSKSQVTRLCIKEFGGASLDDTKRRLSKAGTGNNCGAGNIGNKLSEDTKRKISISIKTHMRNKYGIPS